MNDYALHWEQFVKRFTLEYGDRMGGSAIAMSVGTVVANNRVGDYSTDPFGKRPKENEIQAAVYYIMTSLQNYRNTM